MTRRFLLLTAIGGGLAGCGGSKESDSEVREKVKRIRLEANGADKVTIPIGTSVPITLTYTYPESVQETYSPGFDERDFVFAGDHAPGGQLLSIRHLVDSPDGNGNPRYAIEGLFAGTTTLSIIVDGVNSNPLTVSVVPAP